MTIKQIYNVEVNHRRENVKATIGADSRARKTFREKLIIAKGDFLY